MLLNTFFIGDTVILEPFAKMFAGWNEVSIASKFPEILENNPYVNGIHIDSINKYINDDQYKVIDLSNALLQPKYKYRAINDVLGGQLSLIQKPKIYLNHLEKIRISEFRKLFSGIKIGLIAGSRGASKNWGYTDFLVEVLTKKNYHVFIFDPFESKEIYGKNIHYVNDRNLRDFIVKIGAMDLVISPDTGSAHIAGALDIPLITICPEQFIDLYEKYTNCTIIKGISFNANNYKLPVGATDTIVSSMMKSVYNTGIDLITRKTNNGILNVSVNEVLRETNIKVAQLKPPKTESDSAVFIRIRGIGDVLLSLPAIKTYKELHPNTEITYVTNHLYKPLLDLAKYIDVVIGVDYRHAQSGYPPPPNTVLLDSYDEIYNLINKVDFEPDSYKIPRTDMFGKLIGIDDIQYDLDWKIEIPLTWVERLLRKYPELNSDKLISIQVDSKGISRTWQLERQVEVIKKLTDRGYQVVLLSDQRYEVLNPKVINLTSKLSFEEYIAIIKISKLVIGADSSAMHIAGLLNTKALGLYGSVDPNLRINHYDSVNAIISKRYCVPCNDWQKRGCGNDTNCPRCLYEISPRLIYAKTVRLLER